MSPNQLAFVRRQTVKVTAITPDVNAIIRDDRTGPETILLFGLLIQSALSLISPNELSSFLFVAADNSIFGGRHYGLLSQQAAADTECGPLTRSDCPRPRTVGVSRLAVRHTKKK